MKFHFCWQAQIVKTMAWNQQSQLAGLSIEKVRPISTSCSSSLPRVALGRVTESVSWQRAGAGQAWHETTLILIRRFSLRVSSLLFCTEQQLWVWGGHFFIPQSCRSFGSITNPNKSLFTTYTNCCEHSPSQVPVLSLTVPPVHWHGSTGLAEKSRPAGVTSASSRPRTPGALPSTLTWPVAPGRPARPAVPDPGEHHFWNQFTIHLKRVPRVFKVVGYR